MAKSTQVDFISIKEPVLAEEIDSDSPLLILYTSGTTGIPKGVVLSHTNVLFSAIHSLLGYGINRTYKSLIAAPLFHIAALVGGAIPVIYAGGSLVLIRDFNPIEMIESIIAEKINYMFAVPVMYQLITQTRAWESANLSHVKFFISGGAALPLPLLRKVQDEKKIAFAQGYGLTETGRLSALALEDSIRKAGSVGKEVFHVLLKIVDEENNEVSPGAVGEIVVRGPNVFSHYWNRAEETARAFRDGWFHTGDLGWRDDEGFLYIVGRKEEMILFSGENIYPAEVENAIRHVFPQVKDVAVVGKPVSKKGAVVAAFLILQENMILEKETIITSLEGEIADFKIPREIFFVQDFPRNAAGKVLKDELKKIWEKTPDNQRQNETTIN